MRQLLAHRVDQIGERGVEDDSLRVGVVQQIKDLLSAIPEIQVDGHHRDFERRHHRFQVLGTVVQVAHHFRLVGQTRLEKVGGQRVDPAVQFAPCDDPAALCLRRPLRHPPSDGLADIRKVPVGF